MTESGKYRVPEEGLNDDGCTVYGATLSILSILRVDSDKTLRDEFAMAAMVADALQAAVIAVSYLARGKTFEGEFPQTAEGASEYYKTADAMMEARKK